MDIYDKTALSTIRYNIFKESVTDKNRIVKVIGMQSNTIVIKQDYNYTINNYFIVFVANNIKSIAFDNMRFKPEIREVFDANPCIFIPVIYDKKVSELTVEFDGGIVDPIILQIEYQDSDKSQYDCEKQDERNKKICLRVLKGRDLINIYWDKVSDAVDYVKVNLYGVFPNMINGNKDWKRLICSSIQKDFLYKSIPNLAFGDYLCEIIEYDKNNNVIAQDTSRVALTSSVL